MNCATLTAFLSVFHARLALPFPSVPQGSGMLQNRFELVSILLAHLMQKRMLALRVSLSLGSYVH